MPYVKQEERTVKTQYFPKTVGQLTYAMYMIALEYLGEDYSYQDLAEVMGALENTKQEFYRKVVSPYEDKKILENGDIEYG